MKKHMNEDKYRRPKDQLAESYMPSALPVGPDGGLDASMISTVPKVTSFEKGSTCAQGPCRHYWRLVRPCIEATEGTFASLGIEPLREYHHTCLVHPGTETEFADDVVLDCNKWDPLTPDEIMARAKRRKKYAPEKESWWKRFFARLRMSKSDLPEYPPQEEDNDTGSSSENNLN